MKHKPTSSYYWLATFIISQQNGLDITTLKIPDFKNFYNNLEEADIIDWRMKVNEAYQTGIDNITFVGVVRIKGDGSYFYSNFDSVKELDND